MLLTGIVLAAGRGPNLVSATKGESEPVSKEDLERYANPTQGQKPAAAPNAAPMKKYANPSAR